MDYGGAGGWCNEVVLGNKIEVGRIAKGEDGLLAMGVVFQKVMQEVMGPTW